MQQTENTVQSPTGQRRRLWVNIETTLVECHVFVQSIQHTRPGDRILLGQPRRRLTGIEPAMGCNAGLTLSRNFVGIDLHHLYEVHRRQVLNECWPTLAMVVEGIHVKDIFELVYLVLSLIIS